jgi:hypothetical protein
MVATEVAEREKVAAIENTEQLKEMAEGKASGNLGLLMCGGFETPANSSWIKPGQLTLYGSARVVHACCPHGC